nr:hypothetical protein FJNOHHKM_00004 [Escherichia coli]
MHGQRIGYVRVSSFDQNPERQLEQIQVDKVFTEGEPLRRGDVYIANVPATLFTAEGSKQVANR